jgi:hypothetical protein
MMSRIYDALKNSEPNREVSVTTRIWRLVPRVVTRQSAPPQPPALLPPREPDVDLLSLRSAVDRLDARLSHEMTEREGKTIAEMQRAMQRLETELSERFAASVLENRRTLRRLFVGCAFLVASLAGLVVVSIEYL